MADAQPTPADVTALCEGFLAREEREKARFAGPVAADQSHAVAFVEVDVEILIQHLKCAAFEAPFTVEDFVLYVHVDGAWTPRSSFHLRG